MKYEDCFISKLQDGEILLISKTLKNSKYTFRRYANCEHLRMYRNFYDDDIIVVTSLVLRAQSVCNILSSSLLS